MGADVVVTLIYAVLFILPWVILFWPGQGGS